MGLFLGGTNLLTAGTTGGSGGTGGGIPETEIFTSTGRWFVPQSVQDEIASEGHAEVGIFMVGGGGVMNTRGGEIVNQLIQLTTNDYDDPLSTSPSITVVVGAGGGHTGLTEQVVSSFTQSLNFTLRVAQIGNGDPNIFDGDFPVTYPFLNSGTPLFGPNGFPMISSLQAPTAVTRGAITKTLNQGQAVFTYTPGANSVVPDTIDAANSTMSWSSPVEFDGTLNMTYSEINNTGEDVVLTTTYDTGQIRYEIVRNRDVGTMGGSGDSLAHGRVGAFTMQIVNDNIAIRQARGGDNTDFGQFLNNPTSAEGYFGGFSRTNLNTGSAANRPNSGQPGQGGYLQIFYN